MEELEILKSDYDKRQEVKENKIKPLKKIFRSCNYCEFVHKNLPMDNCLVKSRSILAFEVLFCRYYKIR